MITFGSYIYRLIAKVIFSPLLLPNCVESIYLRRSAATGEAVFGKSDIDLAIIIDNFKSAQQELPLVRGLSKRYNLLKRICPVLGELFIFNREDLMHWHKNKPFRGILAKHWVRLYGQSISSEEPYIPKEDILAEFCFWLFDMLPKFYIKKARFRKNTRHCVVALLEMYNAFFTLEGSFPLPKARKDEVLDFLIKKNKNYRILRKPLTGLKANNDRSLKNWIYTEALKLAERMFLYGDEFSGDNISEKELISKSPPSFISTKYILIDDIFREDNKDIILLGGPIHDNFRIIPTTTKALKLYLGYWNPWEYYSIHKLNPSLKLPEPSRQAMCRYLARNINMHLVRYPLIMNRYYYYYRNIILQARLINDYNIICRDKEELRTRYSECYGNWPFSIDSTRRLYLEKEYQLLWDLATKLNNELKGFCNNSG